MLSVLDYLSRILGEDNCYENFTSYVSSYEAILKQMKFDSSLFIRLLISLFSGPGND